MKLEDQVVSLELAKKLKEAGYKQKGLWWWQHNVTGVRKGQKDGSVPYVFHSETKEIVTKEEITDSNDDYSGNYRTERCFYAAPTVAELGDKLKNITVVSFFPYYIKKKNVWHIGFKESNIDENTEANARAKMWLYLKENNLL
jgi:hypothetical protein